MNVYNVGIDDSRGGISAGRYEYKQASEQANKFKRINTARAGSRETPSFVSLLNKTRSTHLQIGHAANVRKAQALSDLLRVVGLSASDPFKGCGTL